MILFELTFTILREFYKQVELKTQFTSDM